MATPALMFEMEHPVEERIARLEADVGHIRTDISDMKIDIRRMNDKIDAVDQRLTARIDDVDKRLTAKIDAVDQRLTGKMDGITQTLASMVKSHANDRVWWLLISGGLLGVMARGFKWI